MQDCSHSSCLTLIGCQAEEDHPLHPGINKQAQQLKCHHLLCNTGCAHAHVSSLVCKCDQICVCACTCLCVCEFPCVLGRQSQVSSPSSAPKLMIWGPENQQIRAPWQVIMESTTCLWMCLKTAPLSSLSTPHYVYTTDAFTTQTHV